MVAHPTPPLISVEEYLELEENSTVKHEYIDGHVYAMAGGTIDHGIIAVNAVSLLRPHLRGGPCRIYNSDVKVRLAPRRYVYPDASVGCDPRDRVDGRAKFISYPRLVLEVLSPSTATYDRGDKFAMYRAVSTFEEYVLIDAEQMAIEVWRRQASGDWTEQAFGPHDTVVFATIDFHAPVAAFYEDVAL